MAGSELYSPTLRSTVTSAGELRLALDPLEVGSPAGDEVVVAVEATPVNPSDLGLMLAGADLNTLRTEATPEGNTLIASIPPEKLRAFAGRFDVAMPVGNEGAGTVVRAGPESQALMGRRVSVLGRGMYTKYRKVPARACVPLPDDVGVVEAASMFVNPLTALCMVEAMKREGHHALVHTAAASNLGQMLNRICITDGIGLVNIVRSSAQADLLRSAGAPYVVDSSSVSFQADLCEAIARTGATLAFDAIGGGKMANSILHAMEAAAVRAQQSYSLYGSSVHKQVYIYGMLDTAKTEIDRGYGFAWGIGGFLLTPYLQRIGAEATRKLQQRVLREIRTTFASHYTATLALADLLAPDTVKAIARRATGEKYLVDPSRAPT